MRFTPLKTAWQTVRRWQELWEAMDLSNVRLGS